MSEQPNTTPTGDTAALGEHFAAIATDRAKALGPVIANRVATWEPVYKQRSITEAQWATWAPVVRTAVLCANPSSEAVASQLATDALSLAVFASARKMPMKMTNVYRNGTAAAFLGTVTPSSRATVASRVNALVAGVTAAAAAPTPTTPTTDAATGTGSDAPANPANPFEGSDETVLDSVAPLLMDRRPPTRRELIDAGLTSAAAAEALAALSVVRARVKAVEPAALYAEPRTAGRGRAVPYGDVEVVSMLSAAGTARTLKRRLAVQAAICLGVGAGIVGVAASTVRGADVSAEHDATGGPAVRVGERIVPLHVAFTGPVLAAAELFGPDGYVLGGGRGDDRRNRHNDLAAGLGELDPHLVRMNSARLSATWLTMNITRGVPLGDLLAAGGWATTAPLDNVLPYLPRTTTDGLALLTGTHPTTAATAVATAQVSA